MMIVARSAFAYVLSEALHFLTSPPRERDHLSSVDQLRFKIANFLEHPSLSTGNFFFFAVLIDQAWIALLISSLFENIATVPPAPQHTLGLFLTSTAMIYIFRATLAKKYPLTAPYLSVRSQR